METSNNESDIFDFANCGTGILSSDNELLKNSGKSLCENTEQSTKSKGQKLYEWLQQFPTAPIKQILNTRHWN